MKIHIPKELYNMAKQKQSSYRSMGVNKLMIDCVAEVYMEKDGMVPDLKDIQRELRKLSSQFENTGSNSPFRGKKGGWMG